MRYYHVAGEQWQPSDDLLCWDRLEAEGVAVAWKWDDAPAGYDGSVVCLFADQSDAEEYRAEFGGTLLAVELPDDLAGDDYLIPAVVSGYLRPVLTTVEEGFAAVRDGIPAAWLTVIE